MLDRTTHPHVRKEIAGNLREILQTEPDRDFARAICRAVLVNFRTGLAVVPVKRNGKWYPRHVAPPKLP